MVSNVFDDKKHGIICKEAPPSLPWGGPSETKQGPSSLFGLGGPS